MLFTIYVADLFQIIEKHLPQAKGYADDHQVYLSFRPIPFTNQTTSVADIENCVAELRSWMISNKLMVNDSKTDFFIIGSKQQLERVNTQFIHVGEDQIRSVTSVRNLGVTFDSNLKIDMQITKACQNAYYHLYNIRSFRKCLSQDATCTIILAMKIQWRTCPEGSKIQAWYFWQACIRASGMEMLAKWKLGYVIKLQHSSET